MTLKIRKIMKNRFIFDYIHLHYSKRDKANGSLCFLVQKNTLFIKSVVSISAKTENIEIFYNF